MVSLKIRVDTPKDHWIPFAIAGWIILCLVRGAPLGFGVTSLKIRDGIPKDYRTPFAIESRRIQCVVRDVSLGLGMASLKIIGLLSR